ncbi:MAG: hypothetical protein WCJ13_07185 [Coriobacteriia bacterium]
MRSRKWLRIALVLMVLLGVALLATGVTAWSRSKVPQLKSTAVSTAQDTAARSAEGSGTAAAIPEPAQGGKWESGDMHTHTYLTDGARTQVEVAEKALGEYGLDWFANSEHGGMGNHDPFGTPVVATPRWWSLMNWSWPIIRDLRLSFPDKILLQAEEWNVPTHEHASVGFVSQEPAALAEFDYRFDGHSTSTSFPGSPPKDNDTALSAVNGVEWLEANHADSSYLVLNHPSKALAYKPSDVRDFIAAGPRVTAGFEGMPGYQKDPDRGDYGSKNPLARTYQGADIWLAKVGGVWDSILANGSRFHTFANSDFHNTTTSFWPGEYAKNWTFVSEPGDMTSLVDGLKSGRSFSSFGDLIDGLEFSAEGDGTKVEMGRDALTVSRGNGALVTIKFHTPATNNDGSSPKVDHLDLISGSVTGPAVKGTTSWDASTNPSAEVIRTFKAENLRELGNGWYAATYSLPSIHGSMYLRLRATNLAPNTPGMTDAAGNPMMDAVGANSPANAWKSLWFYSNPLWIDVR